MRNGTFYKLFAIFPEVPGEILRLVFRYLSKTDIFTTTLVCRGWFNLAHPTLWTNYQPTPKNIKHVITRLESMCNFRKTRPWLAHPGSSMKYFGSRLIPSYCGSITDDFIKRYLQALQSSNVIYLCLIDTFNVSSFGLELVLQQFQQLRSIDLYHCRKDTTDLLISYINSGKFQKLQTLRLKTLWIEPIVLKLEINEIFVQKPVAKAPVEDAIDVNYGKCRKISIHHAQFNLPKGLQIFPLVQKFFVSGPPIYITNDQFQIIVRAFPNLIELGLISIFNLIRCSNL